jgi:hypothetical protein
MKTYYISNGKEKFGPLTEREVVEAVKRGQINLFDMIFYKQTGEWMLLIQHPDFSDLESTGSTLSVEESHVAIGLLSDEDSIHNNSNISVLQEDTPDLTPIYWHIKSNPDKELTFLDMLFLLTSKKIYEHSLISKNSAGPWRPVIEWKEFSLEFRNKYKKTSKTDLPDVQLRRKFPRYTCGKNFLFQNTSALFKAFCLDTSQAGMSILVRSSKCAIGDVLKIKFNDSSVVKNFDAKGVVISERKVRMPGSEEIFIRYGISFTHFSPEGQKFILNLTKIPLK